VEIDPRGWDRSLRAFEIDVPGDPSSAAFLLAAALIAGADSVRLRRVCVNPTRTGFLDVLASMGATVCRREEDPPSAEPTADLEVEARGAAGLRGADVGGDLTVRSIDEIPILAVVAARAEGVTVFRDAAELRVKESDRIATTVGMLRSFGVEVEERDDGFEVRGTDRPLRAARIHAAGDHRIAMSAAVAALVAADAVRIDDVDNVATSFPSFVDRMTALGAEIDVIR
jgi:3-phosphoshikimate 1-carboxyvinyltransferase